MKTTPRTAAGLLGAMILLLASNGAVGAATAAKARFFPSQLPQLRVEQDDGQIMLTLLGPRLLHVAYGQDLRPGMPYLSPMLATREFAGPGPARWDASRQRLAAGELLVEVKGGCWQVSDTRLAAPRLLTRLCTRSHSKQRLKLEWDAAGHTQLFGLGQHLDPALASANWVGQRRFSGNAMGNAMTGSSIAASGNTQIPIAWALGKDAAPYGLLFDTPYPLQFDFTDTPWTAEAVRGELGLFLFSGPDLKSLRRDYMQLSGRPPVPPLKAFGLWLSEYGYDNWAELDDKLASLRERGFPIDGAVLDLQWFGGIIGGSEETSMGRLRWDSSAFPAASARVADHARQGLGLMLIEESYVGRALPEHASMAQHRLLAMDCIIPCTEATLLDSNPWWGVGGMVDWSNPAAGRWWHDQKRHALIDDGILGHWTDLGEPEQYDENSIYHGFDWYGRKAVRHRDIHNLYNFFWSRSIAEETARTHPQRRPWILSRSGTAGSQRFGVAMWSGDVASSFDALHAQMRAQSNMSLSGFDYYGSDVGGFQRRGIDKEALDTLYTRWFASSALLDVPLRPHVMNLCDCTETAPDRLGDRASNLAALRLRYQLVPYLYSLAHAAWSEGEPVFPPLLYHFAQDAGAAEVVTSKMMGPWLLFTPPATAADAVDVYLPAGRWLDFHHPERVLDSAGSVISQPLMDGPLLRAPLFLRAGAIVPMLRDAPPHLGDLRAAGVRWFSDLLIRLVPDTTPSRFVLVEDDGVSRAYQTGTLARTVLELQRSAAGSVRFMLKPDNRSGEQARRSLTLELLGSKAPPRKVLLNGQPLPQRQAGHSGAGWQVAAGGLLLHLGEHAVDEALEVVLLP